MPVKCAVNCAPIVSVTGESKNWTNQREFDLSNNFKKRIEEEHREPTDETREKRWRILTEPEFRTSCDICEDTQIADLPDWRSPMTSSLWPFATGNKTSTTRRPVTTQGVFLERTKIDGEVESTREVLRKLRKDVNKKWGKGRNEIGHFDLPK